MNIKILTVLILAGGILLSGCISSDKGANAIEEIRLGNSDQGNFSCSCNNGQTLYGPYNNANSCSIDCNRSADNNDSKTYAANENNSFLKGALIGFTYEKPATDDIVAIKTIIDSIETDKKTLTISAKRRPLISLNANEVKGYHFLGWSFDGNISVNNLQNISKIRGFSPVEYLYPPGNTSTISAVYQNINNGELITDNITINWE